MKHKTRPLRSIRKTQAQVANLRVLDKLRSDPKNAAVVRVGKILSLMSEVERVRLSIFRAAEGLLLMPEAQEDDFYDDLFGLPRRKFKDPAVEKLNRHFFALFNELRLCLSRYRWTPAVSNSDYWHLERIFLWESQTPDDQWENRAVQFLLANVQGRYEKGALIERFRRCRQCSDWFYALSDHQLSCQEACRKKYASQNPEFKEKRRRYMREDYRPGQKLLHETSIARLKEASVSQTRRVGR